MVHKIDTRELQSKQKLRKMFYKLSRCVVKKTFGSNNKTKLLQSHWVNDISLKIQKTRVANNSDIVSFNLAKNCFQRIICKKLSDEALLKRFLRVWKKQNYFEKLNAELIGIFIKILNLKVFCHERS